VSNMTKRTPFVPEIGQHVASLNLFLEADGKYYVTVASADLTLIEAASIGDELPIQTVDRLVANAVNIAAIWAEQP